MEKEYRSTPLWDGSLSETERLDYLLRHLTLEEKFQCLGNGCPDIPRLGIKAFGIGGEGAHGLQARHDQSYDKGETCYTTVFPNPIGMSATWDRELIKKAGDVTSTEARALFHAGKHGSLSLWAPTVDMIRDPRWGRMEEGYGEDPFQVGEMAGSYVAGMQGADACFKKTTATLKHFYANNVEEGRTYISSTVDLRNKQEYYLAPFRHIIQKYKAEGIMTAYNEVNGIPAMLLEEEIRLAKKWGVGHIVCDGEDVNQTVNFHKYFSRHSETIAAGLQAGVDAFTDNARLVAEAAKEAYEYKMITEEQIDEALRNHFRVMLRLGLFEKDGRNPYGAITLEASNTKQNHEIARKMTTESVVLLKNNGILPLKKEVYEKEHTLAVLGPLSDVWNKDWYGGMPSYKVTLLEGIQSVVPCTAESGRSLVKIRLQTKKSILQTEKTDGKNLADCNRVCYLGILADGETVGAVEKEQAELFEMEDWGDGKITLRAMSNGKLLVTEDDRQKGQQGLVKATSKEAFGWFVKETYIIRALDAQDAESREGMPAHIEEEALLSWDGCRMELDSKGRLLKAEDGKIQEEVVQKGVKCTVSIEWIKDGIKAAAEAAKKAKTVVLCLGAHPMITCKEEQDRSHIALPLYQQKLMKAVCAVNPQVICVLNSSVSYDLSWAQENVAAVLWEAGGSMEFGNGVADILFGKESPAARLTTTWYHSEKKLPSIQEYDIIQKNRTYQYDEEGILYPFGYGLSYTTFRYKNLSVQQENASQIVISLEIENTGSMVSDEVVQIYWRKEASEVKRPNKTLAAFERVKMISPGQVRRVQFTVSLEQLKYFEVISGEMLLENGEYCFMAGTSCQDIRLSRQIVLQGATRPKRKGFHRTQAQNYDRSEGVVLDSGQTHRFGKLYQTVVCTKNEKEPVSLSYDKLYLEKEAGGLVLDFWQEHECEIEILADDVFIGSYSSKKPKEKAKIYRIGEANGEGAFQAHENWLTKRREIGFREICIPLSKVPYNKEFTLTIRWKGMGKLASLYFVSECHK